MTHKEITVARAAELKDGEMKQVAAGGTDILIGACQREIPRGGS